MRLYVGYIKEITLFQSDITILLHNVGSLPIEKEC